MADQCLRLFVLFMLAAAVARGEMRFITAATTNGSGLVTSLTDAGGTYALLTELTSITNTLPQHDYIALQPAAPPTNFLDAVGGFDITRRALNDPFRAQFGYALADTTRIFVMNSSATGIDDLPGRLRGQGRWCPGRVSGHHQLQRPRHG